MSTQAATTPQGEILTIAKSAIDLFLEYRDKHKLAQFIGSTAIENIDEFARSRAMGEVLESLEEPSPTLAAMLAGPELLAQLKYVYALYQKRMLADYGGEVTIPAAENAIKKAEATS